MKHLKVLSTEKPAKAEEIAGVQLKDIVGPNLTKGGASVPLGNMDADEVRWLTAQWDNWLQK